MIGIFLGSFNPPHIGHVNCVTTVLNKCPEIDEIIVIPTMQNPNKQVNQKDTFNLRYYMCHQMFRGIEKCNISDIDKELTDCTYTFEKLSHYKSIFGEDLVWIITIETLWELLCDQWKNSEELLRSNNFYILYNNEQFKTKENQQRIIHVRNYGLTNFRYIRFNNFIPINSTTIREKVKSNEEIQPWVNLGVSNIIKQMKLYDEVQ